MILKEAVPFVIFFTIIIGLLLIRKTNLNGIFTIDGFFSLIGTLLGLLILALNLIYTNNYLITIGPLLVITCLLYLQRRNEILIPNTNFNLKFDTNKLKIIKIVYWACITIGLISYYHAIPYYRPPLFFISISIGITMIALEILSSKKNKNETMWILIKILIISLIIRNTAYFISPYPVGSDPWGHADFIRDICSYGSLNVPLTHTSEYYVDYPIMHIYAAITCLIGDLSIKNSMSIIGLIVTISTIFVYLIAKKITKDNTISLLAALLINFADFHIRWSIEVIAMTFGIALFTTVIYIIVNKDIKNQVISQVLLIAFILIISWTHTVSSFILLISIISLYIGSLLYGKLYQQNKENFDKPLLSTNCLYTIYKQPAKNWGLSKSSKITTFKSFEKPFIGYNIVILFGAILMFHWMDPRYAFLQAVTRGIITALSHDANFLGRTDQYTAGNLESILNIVGFLIYIALGIIGSLYSLSRKQASQTKFTLIFTQIVLLFIFFIFPLFGVKNLMPDRWPAFIYICSATFVGLGLIKIINIINKKGQILLLLLIIFTSSFFMTTNSSTNRDSPIYGEEINEKLIWTESEITLFTNINKLYEGVIVSDSQTINRPFRTYLKREKIRESSGNLDRDLINDKMFIWREVTLTSSVYDRNGNRIFLGRNFMKGLEINLNKIYDTGGSKAYLGKQAL